MINLLFPKAHNWMRCALRLYSLSKPISYTILPIFVCIFLVLNQNTHNRQNVTDTAVCLCSAKYALCQTYYESANRNK